MIASAVKIVNMTCVTNSLFYSLRTTIKACSGASYDPFAAHTFLFFVKNYGMRDRNTFGCIG